MQVEGIYTGEAGIAARRKALEVRREMELERLRAMPVADRADTSKSWDRKVRTEVEARVPETVRQAQKSKMFAMEAQEKTLPIISKRSVAKHGPDGGGSGRTGVLGQKPEAGNVFRGGFGANRVRNELQAVTQELAQARYDQAGHSRQVAAGTAEPVWKLVKQKKELDRQYSALHPTPLRRAINFAGDALDVVIRASPAAAFSGMEQDHSYVEALANRAAAWALRDLSKAQVLKLPSAKPVAEKMRALADRMATDVDYTKAQQWQDYYQSVMDEVMDGHSETGKWVLDKVAAVGTAAFDKGVSLVTGVPVLPLMGVRAGGNAALRTHNKGANDAQALAIGLETAAVEMMTEKLFGGNPMYDTDVGVVNTLVGKLTDSESVTRVLDSTAFNIAAEGVEEVIAELGEAPFEGLVLNKTAKGTVSKESLGDAFLGGVFLAGVARINGYVMGTSAALDEAHTRHYAEILAKEAGKSNDSNVQRAATELQDQLDFGSAPTEKDVGHLVSVLDKAGETSVVDNVIREVEQAPLDTRQAENAENGKVVEEAETDEAADFDDIYEQMYPDSVDPYSKIRYNPDGTIVVTDDWTKRGHQSIPKYYCPNAVLETAAPNGQHDRTIYGKDGRFTTQIHGGDHCKSKQHPFGVHGEHAHDYYIDPITKSVKRATRELTPIERIQHADIIGRQRK